MYYASDNHIYSFSPMTAYILPVWPTYFFSYFMPITFEIVHPCVSIQNTIGHKVLSDRQKYFPFVTHILSITSMIP